MDFLFVMDVGRVTGVEEEGESSEGKE